METTCVLWTPLSPMVLCLVTIPVVMTAHAMHGVCVLLVDGWVCGVVRLPLWYLSTTSAKLHFALLIIWSKSRLCMLILGWWIILVLPLVIRLGKYYRFC
jgi:hypothetical protein